MDTNMAKDPSFPFYASDWLGSNTRAMMTLEQQGAYINLLARQWSDPTCSLPDDDEALAKLSEMGEGWFNGGSQMVRKCFPKIANQPSRIANEKLLELRAERDRWIEKSSAGGRKSGQTRKMRSVKGGSTTVPTKREPNANSPSSSPSSYKPPYPQEFKSFWETYPRRNGIKVGKEKAAKVFRGIADVDVPLLMTALEKYKASSDVQRGCAKDAERWLREWRDWLDIQDNEDDRPLTTEQLKKMKLVF